MTAWTQKTSDYRVIESDGQWHAEMLFWTKDKGEQWVPLNEHGSWADPDCYSTGEIKVRAPMRKETAERAIWLAMKVNRP